MKQEWKYLLYAILAVIAAWLVMSVSTCMGQGVISRRSTGATTKSASDNFNRADGNLGTNWTPNTSAFQIASNIVIANGGETEYGTAYTGAGSWPNNQRSTVTVSSTSGGAYLGVSVRCNTTGDTYYVFYVNGTTGYFAKVVSGSYTGFDSGTSVASGNTISIEASGTNIIAKVNGSQVYSATDSDISSGYPGLAASSSAGTQTIDSWQGEEIP